MTVLLQLLVGSRVLTRLRADPRPVGQMVSSRVERAVVEETRVARRLLVNPKAHEYPRRVYHQ